MFLNNEDEVADIIVFDLLYEGKESVGTKSVKAYVNMLANGNVAKKVKEIEKEVDDISTPEQKLVIAKRIDTLMKQLVVLRHGGKGFVRKYVEGAAKGLMKVLGTKNPQGEINLRLRDAIRRLSTARDKLLKKKFDRDKEEIKD